ncbi:methyltransferase [Prosthecobacter sp.]|uniref:methyltransferase n=1 Tax=Prosthecobacter sp. TaxID=1965333 RepID=UPI003784422D
MMHDLTSAPTTDPTSIYRYRDCLYAADMVTAALSVDFFTWLSGNPSSLEGICGHFGFTERPCDTMMTLFAANGWVKNEGGAFHTTEVVREFLCAGTVWEVRPYFASLHDRPIARDFLEVLKTDKPAGWSGDKAAFDWHKAMEQEDFARKFTAAMDCRGVYLSQALAKKLDLTGRTCLLDIGAGSGIYACAITAQHPHMKAVAFDQAPVDRIAGKLIEERGCAERVSVATGNMFEGMPSGCDVHLFSNVLHDWGVPEVKKLLAASHAALPKGGLLIIHDAIINADKTGPLHVAEYSCLLMHSTQGKCYSTGEYATLLDEAGFTPAGYHDTQIARGFMTAIRR